MPIARLRAGRDEALHAIRQAHFFLPGGPRREEILFMSDLLRQGETTQNVTPEQQEAANAVRNCGHTHAGAP